MDWVRDVLPWLGALTGATALVFTFLNWRRAGRDPERLDIALQVADMKNRIRSVESAIILNLMGEGTEGIASVQHLERVVVEDLCRLLEELKAAELVNEARRWSNTMTSDPFPRSSKGKKQKRSDQPITGRQQATARLVGELEKLRVQALRRRLARSGR